MVLHATPIGGGERSVLVGTGTLYRVQPQRVICKRIVLSGHPYKINKRSAVIRYMFFNRGEMPWGYFEELMVKGGSGTHKRSSTIHMCMRIWCMDKIRS